ncbi:MAG: hypothetical protein R3301_10465 [Saprospiraceae bacterium]|nr:hypothetical protein [Saprospiraceae bacterium]
MLRPLLLATLGLIMLPACSIDYYFDRKEEKIIGAWEFEKVTYKKDSALFSDNITHEYRNDILEFFGDYTAIYDDFSLGAVFDGEWSLIYDQDDEGHEFFVDAMFFDFLAGEDFALFGSIDRLDKRVLRLEAYDNYGKFVFKLRRL